MTAHEDGGPAFPVHKMHTILRNDIYRDEWYAEGGMTLRDWFATFAPDPTDAAIASEADGDRLRNPHGDSYKPARRSVAEIRAQLRYQHADQMLKARQA